MATNQPQAQTVGAGADKAKLGLAILLALAGFGAYFFLEKQEMSNWMRWLALLALLACAAGAFMWSSWGKQFLAYCKDSAKEVKKVVWPTRKEAAQMTLYVFIFVLIMAFLLWVIDMLLQWGIFGVILGWR